MRQTFTDIETVSPPAPPVAAPKARLKIVAMQDLDITRRRVGRSFSYVSAGGERITDPETLARILSLAVPPAYRDVRISSHERAHLQAIGRDEAGRWQYRYHPDWDDIREKRKASRLAEMIEVLPKIRAAVQRDLASPALDRAKAAACAVALIDQSHIRVGGEAYARDNGSHGAATLLKRHAAISGRRISLRFRGKGGKTIECVVENGNLARALGRMKALPGQRLLKFVDEGGSPHAISAADINAYLRRISGQSVTAKDFRMLAASALAAEQLATVEPSPSQSGQKRQLAAVMRLVAEQLANTPAVVRKSYVHRLVVKSFESGKLAPAFRKARTSLFRQRAENALGRLAVRLSKRKNAPQL